MDWPTMLFTAMIAGTTLALQALVRALWYDIAKRFSLTVKGIQIFDILTRKFLRDPVWSGKWTVTWYVKGPTFQPENIETRRLYRCFNSFTVEGVGITSSGNEIPYVFVGKFSRDKTIATGVWYDNRGSSSGYHGAFQVRVIGEGNGAKGRWLGFSETTHQIKSDKIEWQRSGE